MRIGIKELFKLALFVFCVRKLLIAKEQAYTSKET